MYRKLFTFEEMNFNQMVVNGWTCREAEQLVKNMAFDLMCEEMPELRCTDDQYFEFDIDWVCGNVWVTEREFEFAGE